ncbi:MAG: hypothetical protein VW455_08345 [Nitrospinota bacterium]
MRIKGISNLLMPLDVVPHVRNAKKNLPLFIEKKDIKTQINAMDSRFGGVLG